MAALAAEPGLDPDRLFQALAGARGLVLAVSGGPDSTALMLLMSRWQTRPPCVVVCVDHGLRSGSADEARTVAANAAVLGLPARIVRAPKRDGGGNLQDWARRVRYACLAQVAREAGYDVVVTAHHLDDQAETFLIRLKRGSGVYGLAAMAAEGRLEGLRLARPLLQISRAALSGIASQCGLPLADDPGNYDPAFDRVRLRRLMPALAEEGLTPERLAGTARRMRRAAAALDHYAGELIGESFTADGFGVVTGAAEELARVPDEIGLRTLALVLRAVGGADYPPPLDRTEALLAAIRSGGAPFRRTLIGVVVEQEGGNLSARREWGRTGLPSVPAQPGSVALWDGRFQVTIPSAPGLMLGGLGRSTRKLRSNHADSAVIRTLPGLFRGDTLLAAPAGIWAADEGDELERLDAECRVGPRLGLVTQPLITI